MSQIYTPKYDRDPENNIFGNAKQQRQKPNGTYHICKKIKFVDPWKNRLSQPFFLDDFCRFRVSVLISKNTDNPIEREQMQIRKTTFSKLKSKISSDCKMAAKV